MIDSILNVQWGGLENQFLLDFIKRYRSIEVAFEAFLKDHFEALRFIEMTYAENVHDMLIENQRLTQHEVNRLIEELTLLTRDLPCFLAIWIDIVKTQYREMRKYTCSEFNKRYVADMNGYKQLSVLVHFMLLKDRSKRRKVEPNYFAIFHSTAESVLEKEIVNVITLMVHRAEASIRYKMGKLQLIAN